MMPLRAGNTSNVVMVAYRNIAIVMEIDGVYIIFGFHGKYIRPKDTIWVLMMLELLLLLRLLLLLLLRLLLLKLLMLKFFYLLLTVMIMRTSSHWSCNAISH
jgi:hypothetical protein